MVLHRGQELIGLRHFPVPRRVRAVRQETVELVEHQDTVVRSRLAQDPVDIFSVSPTYLPKISAARLTSSGRLTVLAKCRTQAVLPVPGGPKEQIREAAESAFDQVFGRPLASRK